MPDGGTIINRLSDTIIFSVNAKWIAAARQGGTPVSATYMIQEYVNGEWVNTKVDGQDVTMTIDNFGAETMELYKEFGTEVPMYDEHGKRIEYRIVQTYVTRTDNGFTGYYDQMVYDQDNPTTITLHNNSTDGDQYEIRISTPDEADRTYTFDFVYRLTGKYDIFIQKIWDDTNNPAHTQEHPVTHADETITVNIEQRDCDTPTYHIYTPGVEVKITDTDYNNTPWTEKQSVDVYDDEGHEVYYRIKEPNPPENYFQVYSYDREKQLYTVKNIYAVGPTHLIETRKEWQDDGELEYRKPLDITASEDVYSPDNTPTGQTLQVNESNVWYCEFNRDFNYSFNSDHFREKASGSNNTYYHNLENISTDSRVPSTVTENGKKWIYLFDQTTNPTGDNVIIENEISNNIIFFDNDDFAGIYKDEDGHYYAVEMKYTPADTTVEPLETSSRAYLTIINTRIGIVKF